MHSVGEHLRLPRLRAQEIERPFLRGIGEVKQQLPRITVIARRIRRPAEAEVGSEPFPRRHIPDILPMVSSTGTPMHYTAEIIKKEDPQATTFFVGPCVAKRHEAMMDDLVDFVLTFEEIDALFTAKDINPSELDETDLGRDASKQGRGFPLSGGVAGAVQSIVGDKLEVKPVAINGLTAANMRILKAYAKNGAPGNLIEVMACPGGCSCGPAGCAGRVNEAVKGARKLMEESPDLNDIKANIEK